MTATTRHRQKLTRSLGLLAASATLLLGTAEAGAYSTNSNISVARTFSPTTGKPGQKVTVTLTVTVGAIGSSPIRGFYLSDAVPDSLTAGNHSVTLNGSAVTAKNETTASGAIHSGCKTVRWVLETPPSWTENNPVNASSTITVTYDVTVPSSMTSGTLSFPGYSWVAMIPAAGDTGDHFGYEDQAATVPVVGQPQLALSPTTLTFSAQEGDPNPGAKPVGVSNTGGGTLAKVTTAITYGSGASGWLTVTNNSSSGNSQTLNNAVDLAGLAPNTYSATVQVSEPAASNSPQSYTVSFTVTAIPSTTQPTIALDPTSLQFTAEEGGGSPAAETVSVTNSGAKTLAQITHKVSYVNGASWLRVTTSGQDNAQSLENTVVPVGLAPDTYTATVEVTSAGASNTPQNYTVSFTVTPKPLTSDSGPSVNDAGPGVADAGATEGGTTNALDENVLEGGCGVAGGSGSGAGWLLFLLSLLLLRRLERISQ